MQAVRQYAPCHVRLRVWSEIHSQRLLDTELCDYKAESKSNF